MKWTDEKKTRYSDIEHNDNVFRDMHHDINIPQNTQLETKMCSLSL